MIGIFKRLRQQGYLGINRRNGHYILGYNQRRYFPLVDNKLETKKAALAADIQVPPMYHLIEIEKQNKNLFELLKSHDDFVLKPAEGSGGKGIWVIVGRKGRLYRRSSGVLVTEDDLMHHVSSILSGMYSLSGTPDQAYMEYRVQQHDFFTDISYRGVPDIRTILFRGVPVMAMLRLPTQSSDGKANLHQGAVGVGIDLATGRTTFGIANNQRLTVHPDTSASIQKLLIPDWDVMIRLATACYQLAPLDYMGVDIVLDKDLGPMLLELNARPGLSIQICNQLGLEKPLQAVEKLLNIPGSVDERVKLGKDIYQQVN